VVNKSKLIGFLRIVLLLGKPFFFHGSTTIVVQGLLIVEVSKTNSDTPNSVGLIWTSDRHVAETCTWQDNTDKRQRFMLLAWFAPTTLENEWSEPHALDRAVCRMGIE